MTTPPFFSLVFVNYQSAGHLRQALAGLFEKEKDASYEVILVNNDQREQPLLEGLRNQFPGLKVLESSNVGFGGGANLGSREAKGRIIGFLNPDLVWKEAILPELQESFLSDKNLGIAGPALLTASGEPEPWSHGSEPTLWQTLKNNLWYHRKKDNALGHAPEEKDWVSGGALFIRKDLFEKLQGFDEHFFLYFEDVDLATRARKEGFRVMLLPCLQVYHKGGQSHAALQTKKEHFYRSQALYFRKHRSFFSYFCLRILRFLRHGF